MGWFNHQLVFYKALFSVVVKNTVDTQGEHVLLMAEALHVVGL